jgi:Tfp pilus assembly protein PilO
MSSNIYLMTIILPLVAIVFIFGLRYRAQVQQAQARLANDEAYRQLAEKAAATQAATATALASIDATLAELKARLSGVEKVLKEVD